MILTEIEKSLESRVSPRMADPIKFVKRFWPQFYIYREQRDIMYSVRDNYETIVPAGNELGKDFIAGLVVLWFFVSRRPCKIVTTAPHQGQLEDVLWGEIRRFIQEAKYQLPIQYNHMHIAGAKLGVGRKSRSKGRVFTW